MALLQENKLVYYHPLNTLTDGGAVLWQDGVLTGFSSGSTQFVAGQVGNAVAMASVIDGTLSDDGVGGYGNFSGTERLTVAFWAADITGNGVIVGFSSGTQVTIQGFQLRFNGDFRLWKGNNEFFTLASAVTIPDSSFHFFVLDAEWTGSDWTARHSVDGGAFISSGTFTLAAIEAPATKTMILLSAGIGLNKLDEVAVWKGAELFFSEELTNLYDLGSTFGEGLDQYSQNFGSPICWQATAQMPDGTVWRDSGSGPCPPVMRVPRGANDIVVTDDGNIASPRIIEG